MSEKLLPCPFGCKAGLTVYQSLDCEYVICDRCESTGPAAKTRAEAIAAWNQRAQPAGKALVKVRVQSWRGDRFVAFNVSPDQLAHLREMDGASLYAAPPAAANQAGIPEGYVLVPVRVTNAMIAAANAVPSGFAGSPPHWQHIWDAMLTYAPHTESHALGGGDE